MNPRTPPADLLAVPLLDGLRQAGAQFGDALRFIVEPRPSVSQGIKVGGLAEMSQLAGVHLLISGAAMVIAVAAAVPLGLYLGHLGRGQVVAVNVSNVGRAVPALALLALFLTFPGLGLGLRASSAIAVLVLFAIPPILTNTYVGVRQVDRDTVDAARGMGMSEALIVARIELPLALPRILSAIRQSAVAVVATATIAPIVNVRTLGWPIINANIYGQEGRLGASIAVAVLALAANAVLAAAGRAATPKGLKLEQGERSRARRGLAAAWGRVRPA